jgi:hypothetical protein
VSVSFRRYHYGTDTVLDRDPTVKDSRGDTARLSGEMGTPASKKPEHSDEDDDDNEGDKEEEDDDDERIRRKRRKRRKKKKAPKRRNTRSQRSYPTT